MVAKVYSNKQEHSNYYYYKEHSNYCYYSKVSKVDSGGSAAEAPFGVVEFNWAWAQAGG